MNDFTLDLARSFYESDDQFPIDLDDAWVWLGYSRKDTCVEMLKKHFVQDLDFSTYDRKTSSGGRPSVQYKLTIDCFKSIGMMVGTEQGKLIRKYFLQCEKELIAFKKEMNNKSSLEILQWQVNELVRVEKEQKELKQQQKVLSLKQNELEIKQEYLEIEHQEIKNEIFEIVHTNNVLENQIDGINSELQRQHSPYGDYFTVMGYLRLIGFDNISVDICKKIGKKVSKLCKDLDVEVLKVKDPRFGYINSYPEYLIKQSLEQENLIRFDLN